MTTRASTEKQRLSLPALQKKRMAVLPETIATPSFNGEVSKDAALARTAASQGPYR